MRRFAERFPSLEMTIVAQTIGNFLAMPTMSPKDEAQILQWWWFEFHHLPGTIAVTATPFFFTSGPEHRRIDEITENVKNWGGSNGLRPAYLVDTDGIVVCSGELTRDTEQEFRELISIMVSRGTRR